MAIVLDLPHPREVGRDGGPLVRGALDPANPSLQVIGWGGRRLTAPLAAGDLVLRGRLDGGHSALAVVADPALLAAADLRRHGLEAEGPGQHVRAVLRDGSPGLVRVAGPDGFILADLVLVRAVLPGEAAETMPPPPRPRPMLRHGSSGPAVAEAQSKLNQVHAGEIGAAHPGLDACPLEVDGKFGQLTYKAVISFQKRAFPGQWAEWDGVIGPKTWAKLDAFAPDAPPIIPPEIPPLIRIVDRPLDPPRWDPILRGAASPSAVVRSGNAVRALIDGRATFLSMVDDINAASGEKDYIYLLGWSYFDNFDLAGGGEMRDLLEAASKRGVQIRAMLWAMPPGINLPEVLRINGLANAAAIRDDETANKTPLSTAKFRAALLAAGVAPLLLPIILATITQKDLIRFGGSHHQKLLVVKRGEILVGYCGGIDIAPNRLNVTGPGKGEEYHDDHCRVRGPAAWDLLETFIRRWKHHPDSAGIDKKKGALLGAGEPVPAPLTSPTRDDAPFGGTTSVVIARTFNPVHSTGTMAPERDIRRLLVAAIRNADRFIYMEDQYLMDLEAAAELNAAVPRIQHLTILILGNALNDVPFGPEYRRDFVERVLKGLSTADRDKVRVFQLSTSTTPPPVFGRHTYVHAKSWVFDDELAVIGSANCNRRGWQHDSEVNAFIFDDPPPQVALALRAEADERAVVALRPTFAQRYRMALWAEHLGVRAGLVTDGVASASLWTTARASTARVLPFVHALPSGFAQAAKDQAADAIRSFVDPVP
jgi:phosphatidylserine/phosphatidylglycerophosphate/cardiolipin synthase-like enzyme